MNGPDVTSFASQCAVDGLSRDEAEVRALEERRLAALEANDVDAVGQLMSEDLVHIHATGAVQDKAAYLAQLAQLPRTTRRESLALRVYGKTAVLTGNVETTLKRAPNLPAESHSMVVTQVATKQAEQWLFVSFHATRVHKPA